MKATVSLQLDPNTLLKLIRRLSLLDGNQDLSEAVSAAIEFWLAEQTKIPDGGDPASVRGYQWKTLFLPEGTVLRSWSYGEHNYAKVEGDEIIHRGEAVSPNQFAQSFARATRNAWSDLYIRRPGDKQFKLACRLRQELAAQEAGRPAQSAPNAVASIPETTVMAMIAAMQAQAAACQPPPPASPAAAAPAAPSTPATPATAPRDPSPGLGWTEPERRKFRFRLEDVAFD